MMKKWNVKTKEYEDYSVPDDWNVSLYETDMNKLVNCASCGSVKTFGEMYTSKTIHAKYGMAYSVCESCLQEEINAGA